MKFLVLSALVLLSLPLLASAAGFAKESLFLSKTPVTEGETVLIHAVVKNESNVKFTGEVIFKDSEIKIGSVAVAIAPGGANAVSVSWKPTAGSHQVSAALTLSDGSVVESESATFLINEKPKPASVLPISPTPIESSGDIQQRINDLSPTAANISAPLFSTLDSVRAKAAQMLDQGIDWAKQKTAGKKPGDVLGTTTKNGGSGIMDTIWLILATTALYLFSVLRFVVGNAGLFYPLFALLFFYILWKLFKRFRRPNYA